MNGPSDKRLYSEPAARNRDPILDVLRRVLPERGRVLEIASGTGEHVVHFAAHLPGLTFCPSDPNPNSRDSIAAWIQARHATNIETPIMLDAASPPWPITTADAIVCINMIHISLWRSTVGLMIGARDTLPQGAPLFLYGPYKQGGVHTAPSNEEFDRSLRSRDPEWGVRDIEVVTALAAEHGFSGPEIVAMPANNLGVIFRRRA